jgi:hypothetical protein
VPCDTHHVLLDCPYFAHARAYYGVPRGCTLKDIFCADSESMFYFVAYVLDLFTHVVEGRS